MKCYEVKFLSKGEVVEAGSFRHRSAIFTAAKRLAQKKGAAVYVQIYSANSGNMTQMMYASKGMLFELGLPHGHSCPGVTKISFRSSFSVAA